ncbi:MAG: DUF983 domain-containing protein [Alphaproteobacteria bacterium]|nr:DUF983 domain-containing protein [Alphaproteobacteria bacterium]
MTESPTPTEATPAKPPAWPQIRRALAGRCPHCGHGKLFKSYLKQVEACTDCGEAYGHIRADDGPAWLTILAVGHIIVPLVVEVEKDSSWPLWVPMVLWPGLALLLALLLLPLAKGLFITLLWRK